MTSLAEKDYAQALTALANTMFPLNEAQRYGRADARLNRECELRLQEVHDQQCVAESMKYRAMGKEVDLRP